MIIKAGTYRFNDVLTFPIEETEMGASFEFILPDIDFDGVINVYGHAISLMGADGYGILVYSITTSADPNTTGVLVYNNETDLKWNIANKQYPFFSEGYGQIITVTADTEVDDTFGTWFTENTQMLIKAGTYRWNDTIGSSIEVERGDVDLPFVINTNASIDGISLAFECFGIAVIEGGIIYTTEIEGETIELPCYVPEWSWNLLNIVFCFPECYGQIITITEDKYVPTNFGLWATSNWKPYTQQKKYALDRLDTLIVGSIPNTSYSLALMVRIVTKDNITYLVGDTLATVWGIGKVENAVIRSYVRGVPVVEIATEAAFGNYDIKSLYIPPTIQEIGGYAFHNCRNLTSVTFGGFVTQWHDRFNWEDIIVSDGGINASTPVTEVVCYDGVVELGTVELSGIWVFRDGIVYDPRYDIEQDVNFTTTNENGDSVTYNHMYFKSTGAWGDPYYLNYGYYEGGTLRYIEVYSSMSLEGWYYASDRIIDFGTEPQTVTKTFYNWLTGNAKPSAEITDLTNTTWYVPSGWSATAGYGIYKVYFLIPEKNADTIWDELSLGYAARTYGKTTEANSICCLLSNSDRGTITSSSSFTITITGGTDATNPDLIAWLQEYGELQ